MSTLHRGHSIDASYQVSVHLAKQFQRRKLKKISQSETRIACGMFPDPGRLDWMGVTSTQLFCKLGSKGGLLQD
jgi:hypothetical protein